MISEKWKPSRTDGQRRLEEREDPFVRRASSPSTSATELSHLSLITSHVVPRQRKNRRISKPAAIRYQPKAVKVCVRT